MNLRLALALFYFLGLLSTAKGQNDIFKPFYSFTVKELENDEVEISELMDKEWEYDEEYFQENIIDKNIEWEKRKNEVKQEIDEGYRNSELIFSKYQVLTNQIKNEKNSKSYLEKSLKEKKILQASYINQGNALDELLKSIINSRKIYGIFKSEYSIRFNDIKNVSTRELHNYGEELIKEHAEGIFARVLYNEKILEKNNLVSVTREIIKNIETSNISIPHGILYRINNHSDTIKVISLVALTMSNKLYDVSGIDEMDEKIELIKTISYHPQTELLYLKGEDNMSFGNYERLRNKVVLQNIDKVKELEEWYNEMKSIIDRSVDDTQGKKWSEEIKDYLDLKGSFSESEKSIEKELKYLVGQIRESKISIQDYSNQICTHLKELKQIELDREVNVKVYKEITRERIFFGKSNGVTFTGDLVSPISALRELLLNKVEELQDKHVDEYSKTYILEINDVASKMKLKDVVVPEIKRVCVLDFSFDAAEIGPQGIKLEIDYGYELRLEIKENFQKTFRSTSFFDEIMRASLISKNEKNLFDIQNRLIWKRIKREDDEDVYGSSCDNLDDFITENNSKGGWRLPTIIELKLLADLIVNSDISPEEYDIKISKDIPYWSSEEFRGTTNSIMRKTLNIDKNRIIEDEKDITDAGFFIWVKDLDESKYKYDVNCDESD